MDGTTGRDDLDAASRAAVSRDSLAQRAAWGIALAAILAVAVMIAGGTRSARPGHRVGRDSQGNEAESTISEAELLVARARMLLDRPRLPGSDWQTQVHPGEDVIELCTRAIALAPHFAYAYDTRAAAYEELGQQVLAAQDRTRAASLRRRGY